MAERVHRIAKDRSGRLWFLGLATDFPGEGPGAFMLEDGRDEEEIVCGLFHDLGFIVCNETHGQFAAMLLGPYISERNRWMLERHMIFQQLHIHGIEGLDRDARERWRGHPHFEWSAEFVEKYDICTIDPARAPAPLETFRPLVERVFARPPQPIPPA